ncbi:conserved hypothetical protein [Catenulispora acidiphila DSM 44928]|uniref:DUF2252 domain-containing protein n=1 Tax=Catenulispora acidiphila (strain DSM 44928 / JCM 14897 / NBRC 102108 / NRRL B-24433 / ID139908) TaxID=479433 RepID=C7PX74_CATAD|nr:DUF2252 domain-containing protein [Catenulispora acidiphila]ACU69425.1 conserved hypothetical protein [Catenulispora acidiphila DSM 44928]
MAESRRGVVTGRPYLTPEERVKRGRSARRDAPRSSHGEWEPAPDRRPVIDQLEAQASTSVADLVPIRYGRMIESPFRFYRGAASIMAADLASTPRSEMRAQLCGDAHLLNFRLLGSPERRLVFDINDFDETLRGPWEWDVKRLAASLAIAGRENGFDDHQREIVVRTMAGGYREAMRAFAGMTSLDVWYAHGSTERIRELYTDQLDAQRRKNFRRMLEKAKGRDSLQAAEKLTTTVDGRPRIVADPPLVVPLADLLPDLERGEVEAWIRDLVRRYSRSLRSDLRMLLDQYRVVDMARKVVGVGSVGTRCWIVLLAGSDEQDPLFLQIKEANRSVLADYAGESPYAHQGHRVVAGQRLMQAVGDILLGWKRGEDAHGGSHDFYVRQLRDWKGILESRTMVPHSMRIFGELCGATLARAHARSSDRIAIASYLGKGDGFDRALARFAEVYADQNERDHQALVEAVDRGRIRAQAA